MSSRMDPTVKALAFVKRITAKTVQEAGTIEDRLMLIDLWERELGAIRKKLVVDDGQSPAGLLFAEQREVGDVGKL